MVEVEILSVFYAGKRTHKGKPAGTVDRQGARDLVESGLAEWTNPKCASIKLTRKEAEMYRPDESLTMGPLVTYLAAEGVARYVAMAQAWDNRLFARAA